MNDRDALLRAVCDNPDDDLPRLVFADWLEENGEPERAEFIRVQIELHTLPQGGRRTELSAHEKELLSNHGQAWVEPLTDYIYHDWSEDCWEFRRGFVEWIDVLGETIVESGAELFRLAPIREVRMPDEEGFDELARCKHLLRLRGIDLTASGLSSGFGPAKLFRSRYLANLTALIACGYDDNCHLDVAGIRGIVGSKYLGRLQKLDVSNNWFDTDGTLELLKARNLTALEELEFEGVGMGDDGAFAIAETVWMSQLKVLNLVANGIGDRGARALLFSRYLDQIQRLDLRDNQEDRQYSDEPEPISPATKRSLQERFGDRVLL